MRKQNLLSIVFLIMATTLAVQINAQAQASAQAGATKPMKKDEVRKKPDETIFQETRGMVRDFSELLEAVTEAVDDDPGIDSNEAIEIRQRWEDLKACVERFVIGCERGHYHIKAK